MIIDSKVPMYPPPPPYASSPTRPSASQPALRLETVPSHVLLHIVYSTFPQTDSVDHGKIERQRKTLLWLVNSLRLVNRSLYIGAYTPQHSCSFPLNHSAACMHVLRSTYLPAYQSLIRPPYTSDPFPTTTADSRSPTYTAVAVVPKSHPIQSLQRETAILDRFITLKVRQDVFLDESELHLDREDLFKDLFDHAQPKARLEDLVRKYGLREGVIALPGAAQQTAVASSRTDRPSNGTKPSPSGSTASLNTPPASPLTPLSASSSSQPRSTASRFFGMFSKPRSGSVTPVTQPTPPPQAKINPVPFRKVSISLSPRTIGFVVGSGGNRRTLAQVQRGGREESLEIGAKRLITELKEVLLAEAQ